ncbi:probable glucan 1,3-beta-glucosidase A [Tanacetum coccineum]
MSPSRWETFRLWRVDENKFQLRVYNKQFLGLDSTGIYLVSVTNLSKEAGIFKIIKESESDDPTRQPIRVRIKAPNDKFLQATTEDLVTADAQGDGPWANDDPSVFSMMITKRLTGEYQLTNGYGPNKAPQIMEDHWSTYIVEADSEIIAQNGLNGVRIPVGWWTAFDPTPPPPYVGGSRQYLDNAFLWAKNNNLKVILDLHAANWSQNGQDHSSSRDGTIRFGQTEESIQSLYAIELLNEPHAPEVLPEKLIEYYEAGFEVVRRRAPDKFVILSSRIGGQPQELFEVAKGKSNVVIDVHYYNLYTDKFAHMTIEEHIKYIQNDHAAELKSITNPNGPLIFVGEWAAIWQVTYPKPEDFQNFAEAQLNVYGEATFGWAFWSQLGVAIFDPTRNPT